MRTNRRGVGVNVSFESLSSKRRIVILGNSGAGKSHLAQTLAAQLALPVIELDHIFWLDGGYQNKRTQKEVWALIDRVREQERWIVEGVYGAMVERLLDRTDLLIWMALSWTECSRSLIEREAVRHAIPSPEQEKSVETLMAYAAAYDQRTNDISRQGHQRIFDAFGRTKSKFNSREDVNQFIGGFVTFDT
jgi:adenylate kinase family enzyme